MNQAARRIGRTLAFVLPVVLVLSGTLAVATVPWTDGPTESRLLNASSSDASSKAGSPAPQDVLRSRLLAELQEKDPGAALTALQQEMAATPSLAKHCGSIARALGQAAVAKYGAARAQRFSRPVCDTSFASGVSGAR
ncbi:hypothetical protein SRB5_32300 [Streptomyces sp. RB5]|uniref:Uncharacterized protein n=1 Tax=Streptomyces smaragdinus TaxID=2585196 RepID=A0A7K0CHX4_9ACTN|nr:hypothetical protein [Streptomyces smaragdinus]MQY13089.1 hypothetical protein [Streptomyces smaragdinus]